jgi:conjugative relaxase-like TrwC/TraI family protein
MLRITTVANAKSAEKYYSSADYYLDEEAVPALWHGKGAELLGLQGEVAFEHFSAVCQNEHPFTGKRITAALRSNRRVAYDLTFSVSKSVSILYALAGDDRILSAFRTSVRQAMQVIERDAAVRVRKNGKDENRITGNLVYSDFVHRLTRPVAGVPQPHLHAHVVVQNMSYDHEEGIWKAAQLGSIKASAPYFQAVFRAKLAEEIQALGYQLDFSKNDFEVKGVPTHSIKQFSKRTEEVESLAKELRVTRPETKAKLGRPRGKRRRGNSPGSSSKTSGTRCCLTMKSRQFTPFTPRMRNPDDDALKFNTITSVPFNSLAITCWSNTAWCPNGNSSLRRCEGESAA